MTDDGLGVLVFLEKLTGAGEGDLVDVLLDLVGRHADTPVAHGERAGLLVDDDLDLELAQLALVLTLAGERLQLLGGIHSVGHHLADENVAVAVEKFFDDGEDVLRRHTNVSCFH